MGRESLPDLSLVPWRRFGATPRPPAVGPLTPDPTAAPAVCWTAGLRRALRNGRQEKTSEMAQVMDTWRVLTENCALSGTSARRNLQNVAYCNGIVVRNVRASRTNVPSRPCSAPRGFAGVAGSGDLE